MPTTPKGLRYPASSAAPNVPQDIQNLASDVNTALPGQWLKTTVSGTNYVQVGTTTWTDLAGFVQSVTVPSGRELEVEFKAPAARVGSGFIFVQLLIGGTQEDMTVHSGAGTYQPVKLMGSKVGTGASITYRVQVIISSGADADVRADPKAPIILRHRIV